jgi:hypothetical protein
MVAWEEVKDREDFMARMRQLDERELAKAKSCPNTSY